MQELREGDGILELTVLPEPGVASIAFSLSGTT